MRVCVCVCMYVCMYVYMLMCRCIDTVKCLFHGFGGHAYSFACAARL